MLASTDALLLGRPCFTDSTISHQLATLSLVFPLALLCFDPFVNCIAPFPAAHCSTAPSLSTPHPQLPYGGRNRYEGGGKERLDAKTLKPHARSQNIHKTNPHTVYKSTSQPQESLPTPYYHLSSPTPLPPSHHRSPSNLPSYLRRTSQRPTPGPTLPQLDDALLRPLGTDGPRFRTLKPQPLSHCRHRHISLTQHPCPPTVSPLVYFKDPSYGSDSTPCPSPCRKPVTGELLLRCICTLLHLVSTNSSTASLCPAPLSSPLSSLLLSSSSLLLFSSPCWLPCPLEHHRSPLATFG